MASRWFSRAAVAVPLIVFAGVARGECPQGCLSCGTCNSIPFDACQRPWSDGHSPGTAQRDLVLSTTAVSTDWNYFVAGESATVQDSFVVTGPADGTPVSIIVRLAFRGTGFGEAYFIAFLEDGISPATTYSRRFRIDLWTWTPPDSFLTLQMTVAASQPFFLRHGVSTGCNPYPGSGGFADARMSGALRFEGLPPGARVTSCNGYLQDGPVAARPASWGNVKIRYR